MKVVCERHPPQQMLLKAIWLVISDQPEKIKKFNAAVQEAQAPVNLREWE